MKTLIFVLVCLALVVPGMSRAAERVYGFSDGKGL